MLDLAASNVASLVKVPVPMTGCIVPWPGVGDQRPAICWTESSGTARRQVEQTVRARTHDLETSNRHLTVAYQDVPDSSSRSMFETDSLSISSKPAASMQKTRLRPCTGGLLGVSRNWQHCLPKPFLTWASESRWPSHPWIFTMRSRP